MNLPLARCVAYKYSRNSDLIIYFRVQSFLAGVDVLEM